MDHIKLTNLLEILCQSGCDTVNAAIEALEKNHPSSLIDDLSPEEHKIVLQELKSIMSVYKR